MLTPKPGDPILQALKRRRRIQGTLCLAVLGLNLCLLAAFPLKRLDRAALDQFLKYRPPLPTDPSILYIEIAEDSLKAIGRWPWPRHYHAVMTRILHTWGAKAVMFDILFSEPGTPFDDAAMAEALREADSVYLPMVLEKHQGKPTWVRPLPELEHQAKAIGHINALPDRDGILRRIQPYLQTVDGERHPHLALQIAFGVLGRKLPASGPLPFPTDTDGTLLVNWAGRWTKTFRHYSYVDVLRSFEAAVHGKEPLIPPGVFKGKICLIGLTAVGHTDIKANPLEAVYPALGFHANVINSILTHQFIRTVSFQTNAFLLLWIGLIASLLFLWLRPVPSLLAGLGMCAAWVIIAFTLFCRFGLWLSLSHPILCIATLFVASVVYIQVFAEKEQQRLSQLATRDGLTGLYVIRHFRMLLSQALEEAKKRQASLSVLMLDIDHFKKINDTYGHAAGDRVLKQVANVLQSCLRETDDAGRYGGEEFIIMLPRTPLESALKVAERIRAAVADGTADWRKGTIPVTISIGVSALRSQEMNSEAVIQRADQALYRAKNEGRNRVCSEPSP